MSILKKSIFLLVIAITIFSFVYGYFYLKSTKKPSIDALSVLPDSCILYLKTSNFTELNKKINSQSLIIEKLKAILQVNEACETIKVFDSIISQNTILKNELLNNPIHFALYPNKNKWLLTFNLKELRNQSIIEEEVMKLVSNKKINSTTYQLILSKKIACFVSLKKGIVYFFNNCQLFEKATNTLTKKLISNSEFINYKNSADNSQLLSVYFDNRILKSQNGIPLFVSGLYGSGINLEPSQLTFNGFYLPDTSHVINYLLNQKPTDLAFLNALPLNTTEFTAFGFDNFFKIKQNSSLNTHFWKHTNDSAMYNVENDFYKNIDKCLFNFETSDANKRFIAFKVNDTLLAKEHLLAMQDSIFTSFDVSFYQLYKKKSNEKMQLLYPFLKEECRFGMYYKSYIYFSDSLKNLENLILNFKTNNLISANENFNSYKSQNFPETFNYLIYKSNSIIKKNSNSINEVINKKFYCAFENFKHFTFSLLSNTSNFKMRCQLKNETQTINTNQSSIWAAILDTTSNSTAYKFINHITNENELIIDDEKNNLYLINAKGNILWKKRLKEKIQSPIFSVDIFKNNKYQVLFNTKNYLHLLDRNGNYVSGYPIKLKSEASSPLTVLDYDSDKNYRLLIACKNKLIYNYTIYGELHEKFTKIKTESEVKLPIQYIHVDKSDYLITIDEEGKIYTFSRKGEMRVGLKNRATAFCNSFYVDASSTINSTYLVFVDDKNSSLNKISFNDKKEIIDLHSDIKDAKINFLKWDENKYMDVFITNKESIMAFDLNGNVLENKKTEFPITESNYYADESATLISKLNTLEKKLLITNEINKKSKNLIANALPLIIDLFNDTKKYLIVTNGNQVYCVAVD